MHQRLLGLRGIEHGTDGAELGDGQYRDQQFRTVLDEDPDHVALADTLGMQVMGDPVGPLVGLGITEADRAVQQRRPLGVALRRLLKGKRQAAGLVRLFDVGDFEPLDHPWQGFDDGRQLTEHHAPGNHVLVRAAHGCSRMTHCVGPVLLLSGEHA
ncbi:hypothetical protein D3C84_357700 [compost metagenome]